MPRLRLLSLALDLVLRCPRDLLAGGRKWHIYGRCEGVRDEAGQEGREGLGSSAARLAALREFIIAEGHVFPHVRRFCPSIFPGKSHSAKSAENRLPKKTEKLSTY